MYGWPPPMPRESARDGEVYKLRFLEVEKPSSKSPQTYGNWGLALVVALIALVIMGAVFFGLMP